MGCRIILIGLLVLVLLLGAAGAALFHYFGWYAMLIIPVVALIFLAFLRVILKRLFLIPFKMKGKVLKDATATVHEVSFTGIKEGDDEKKKDTAGEGVEAGVMEARPKLESAKEQKKYYSYLIDLTIHPSDKAQTSFKYWDPSELMIVPPESKPSFDATAMDDSLGTVMELALFDNGQWQSDFDKVQGENRIRLKIHLKQPGPACKIRYYFYDVATVALPAAGS